MIEIPTRTDSTPYFQFVDAHEAGYKARRAGESLKGLIYKDEPQELGFKAGWEMGGLRPQNGYTGYWTQCHYWEVWDAGSRACGNSAEYENPYTRGSWRWRAFLAGWCVRNYQLSG